MKRLTLKKSLLLFVLPAVLFAFTTKPDKTNYTGTWKLNEGKSELGNFAPFAARKIVVDQKGDSITISKTTPGFNGGDDVTSTETLYYDGRTTESTMFGGRSKRKSTIKWSDDGQSLVVTYTINFEFNGQSSEIKGTDTWTMSADGKTLTSAIASSTEQGDFNMKGAYDKQ